MTSANTPRREIAHAFGVLPMLSGIPGDNTFANYQQANCSCLSQDSWE